MNLENLGRVVITQDESGHSTAYPDTVVGTDSHTPMINGIGVMGWGVGGIEAEAVMLGQPYYLSISRSDRRQAYRPPKRRRHRHGSGIDRSHKCCAGSMSSRNLSNISAPA